MWRSNRMRSVGFFGRRLGIEQLQLGVLSPGFDQRFVSGPLPWFAELELVELIERGLFGRSSHDLRGFDFGFTVAVGAAKDFADLIFGGGHPGAAEAADHGDLHGSGRRSWRPRRR